ncbi:MAG: hypothetical protein ACR2IL_01455, partial [Chitinophagaceae bacterium]
TLNSVNSVNLVHVNYPVNSVNLVHVNHPVNSVNPVYVNPPVNSVNPVCVNYPVLIRAWNRKARYWLKGAAAMMLRKKFMFIHAMIE